MLSIFKKFIHSFTKNPATWFFYAFLATGTLSVRKVLFFYPINESFNEYTGIYIYLSDIFLFLTIISWLFILCNKNSILSIINKAYQQVIHNYTLIFPLLLVVFSFASILWSSNHQIAFYRSIKLLSMVLVFYFIFKNVPRLPRSRELFHVEQFSCFWGGTFLKRVLQIVLVTSIVQSIIGICQFITQHSIGLLWLKESLLSPQITGVAKVIFDGHLYIRAYGLFPHPNILGGFLVFSIISTLLYLKIFHQNTAKCSTWNILSRSNNIEIVPRLPRSREMFHVEHFSCFWGGTILSKWNILIRLTLIIQGIALLLTFSKSAIFGLSIGLFYLYITKCSTWNILRSRHGTSSNWVSIIKMFHVKHFYRKVFLFLSIVILFFLILKPDTYSLIFKSLQERTFYLNVSRGTFLSHPLLGIGAGQFIINMQNIPNLKEWQFQPVHNVFLLILNEFGIIIFLLFVFFIFRLFHVEQSKRKIGYKCSTWNNLNEKLVTNVPRGTIFETNKPFTIINTYFKAILLSFIFIMLFDHYFWDIQQGQILLWLLFGIIAGNNRK